jgi:hypothetical protein
MQAQAAESSGFAGRFSCLGSAHAGAQPAVGADLRAARRDGPIMRLSLLMGSSRKNVRLGDPALPFGLSAQPANSCGQPVHLFRLAAARP